MSMTDISKSLGAVIDERLSNPLVSSFAISWSLINYKFFIVVFSNNTVSQTFELLDKLYSPLWYGVLIGLVGPIVATYSYLYALPYLSNPFFKKWRKNQQQVNGIKDQFPLEALLKKEEQWEFRKEIIELQKSHSDLKSENLVLKGDLQIAEGKAEEFDKLKAVAAEAQKEASMVKVQVGELAAQLEERKLDFDSLRSKYRRLIVEDIVMMQYLFSVSTNSKPLVEAIRKHSDAIAAGFHTSETMPASNIHVSGFDFDEVFRGAMRRAEQDLDSIDRKDFVESMREQLIPGSRAGFQREVRADMRPR